MLLALKTISSLNGMMGRCSVLFLNSRPAILWNSTGLCTSTKEQWKRFSPKAIFNPTIKYWSPTSILSIREPCDVIGGWPFTSKLKQKANQKKKRKKNKQQHQFIGKEKQTNYPVLGVVVVHWRDEITSSRQFIDCAYLTKNQWNESQELLEYSSVHLLNMYMLVFSFINILYPQTEHNIFIKFGLARNG